MRVNVRMFLAVLVGLGCILLAIRFEGGHLQALVAPTSLLIVGTTAFGGLVVLRGFRAAARVLAGAFVVADHDRADRDDHIETLEVLERTALLGGLLGMVFGTTRSLANFDTPQQVGPGLWIAFSSVILAVGANVFFVLPQKQQLRQPGDVALSSSPRQALAISLGIAGMLLVAVAGSAYAGIHCVGLGPVHVLFVLGAFGASAITASDSPWRGPWPRQRLLWYSDALVGSGLLGVSTGLMHVFSVLDQQKLLAPGIAVALASLTLPLVGSVLLRLQRPTAGLSPTEERPGARHLHPLFAGVALAMMAALTAMVVVLCHDTA